ncbi:MAG: hypothetical protein HUJ31_02400, partial [Pseudomonadales bacterium]|nr:hypothetical protein [Pseudomonadales bacterium]
DITATDGPVTVDAMETSAIRNNAIAASLSMGVGATAGIALAGAGAEATNRINNSVRSYIERSTVETAVRYTYQSDVQIDRLRTGDRVQIVEGNQGQYGTAAVGAIYEYIGTDTGSPTSPVGLGGQLYTDTGRWVLVDPVNQDVELTATNESSIESLVGAIAASLSGGIAAVAGSVGVSLSNNYIGVDENDARHQNEVVTYVTDSTINSAGSLILDSYANERVEAQTFAGSVAIAIGLGAAVAGAGAQTTNEIATSVQAYIDDSDVTVVEDVLIDAVSDSRVVESQTIAGAISVGLVAVSVAVSLVDNDITNDLDAYIISSGGNTIEAGGDVSVNAEASDANIEKVDAVTASISGGLAGVSGGGIEIDNNVANTVDAKVEGPVTILATEGDVLVNAADHALVRGDAFGLALSISLGAAIGSAVVHNRIGSAVNSKMDGTTVRARNVETTALAISDIDVTKTAGISGALLAATGNVATATIESTANAVLTNAEVEATEDG